MNEKDTLALFKRGLEAWNAWAEEMLARQAKLKATGEWATKIDEGGSELPTNEVTANWYAESTVDFSKTSFANVGLFNNFRFPGNANFTGTSFEKGAQFNSASFHGDAQFNDARFSGTTYFEMSTFDGHTAFERATFDGAAHFHRATFSKNLLFNRVTFTGEANFKGAKFNGEARFILASFADDAGFYCVKFYQIAWFRNVAFRGPAWFFEANFNADVKFDRSKFSDRVWFGSATFGGEVDFNQTKFEDLTNFERAQFKTVVSFFAAHVERGFSLEGTRFAEVPDFIQAHFAEAPRLDNTRIGPLLGKADADRVARYRALKRLAVQGHDHEREQEYFAGEIKSLRGHHDKPLPNPLNLFRKGDDGQRLPIWPGGARYWFGWGYQIASDFGRSMRLPFFWLCALGAMSVWGYLSYHFARAAEVNRPYGFTETHWLWHSTLTRFAEVIHWLGVPLSQAPLPPLTCLAGTSDPLSAAFGLSIRKALPFAGVASTEKLNQIYACLYGITSNATPGTPLPDHFTPLIPDWVDYLGIIQLLISLVLLFLFLLAVRSHFRIR